MYTKKINKDEDESVFVQRLDIGEKPVYVLSFDTSKTRVSHFMDTVTAKAMHESLGKALNNATSK